MSMKKAFDQTIRDLKREVNKKVLKVPSIEQKVLDATSNESWGPHGSLLADIAQATRNYHDYQMIMSVLWRRLNDTGKNWRHVYKGLTVLEYLVAHGSERVIDEIRERAYQISTLSDFQYIDSGGRDQGNNVRRKSQILVQLVNDKERIQEVRQKAASNREKFHSTSAVGGMYRPGSGGYGDDRYEGHDERNGYGREREWGSRDDERYGRYGDSYSREGDRYGRDSEDQYGRDRYSDDDYRGRAQSVDDFQYGTRSRSSDRGDRAYDDDDRHSARESSVKGEDHADGRPIERKYSEQNIGAPPSYEDAVGVSKSPTYSDRDGEPPAVSAPQSSPPTVNAAPQSSFPLAKTSPQSSSPINSVNPSQVTSENGVSSHPNIEADAVDEFDPRGAVPAAPSISNSAEMDLFGSLSDVFSPSPLALMPTPSGISDFQPDSRNSASNLSFTTASGSNDFNQFFEDPFGDSPFKALPSDEAPAQPRNFASQSPYHLPVMNPPEHLQPASQKMETPNLEFARTFSGITFNPTTASDVQTPPNQQFLPHEQHSMQDNDILAGILPTGPLPPTASNGPYPTSSGMHPAAASQASFPTAPHTSAGLGYMTKAGPSAAPFSQVSSQNMAVLSGYHNSIPYSALSTTSSNLAPQAPTEGSSHQNNNFMGDFLPQSGATISQSSQLAPSGSSGPLALVPQQPAKEKFEPKSTVWADTLSKGLVNLNISGPKINPLSDIGIDFESLNRKEKRMEKPSATPATSNVTMGKAMGSGSGMGRAGAGVLSPSPNAIMNPGMGLGMGMGGGLGMGSYGAMNQLPRGIGEGMGMGMGMRMNMGMGQGVTMQQPNGFAPGPNTNNYNPMMGSGGYPQPYGGAYR